LLNGNLISAFKGMKSMIKDLLIEWNDIRTDTALVHSLLHSNIARSSYLYTLTLLDAFFLIYPLYFLETITGVLDSSLSLLPSLRLPWFMISLILLILSYYQITSKLQKELVSFNECLRIIPVDLMISWRIGHSRVEENLLAKRRIN